MKQSMQHLNQKTMARDRERDLVADYALTCIGVGDVDSAFGGGAEEDADDALAGVSGDAVVVVDDAQQHQRMDDHLLHRPPRHLLHLHHIHPSAFSSVSLVRVLFPSSPLQRE